MKIELLQLPFPILQLFCLPPQEAPNGIIEAPVLVCIATYPLVHAVNCYVIFNLHIGYVWAEPHLPSRCAEISFNCINCCSCHNCAYCSSGHYCSACYSWSVGVHPQERTEERVIYTIRISCLCSGEFGSAEGKPHTAHGLFYLFTCVYIVDKIHAS